MVKGSSCPETSGPLAAQSEDNPENQQEDYSLRTVLSCFWGMLRPLDQPQEGAFLQEMRLTSDRVSCAE